MSPSLPVPSDRDDPAAASPLGAPLMPAARIARRLERAVDRDALERMVMSYATHPSGAGCRRAWLLVWNARHNVLDGWRLSRKDARGPDAAGSGLVDALDQAARDRSTDADPEQLELRRSSVSPAQLTGHAAAAWGRSETHEPERENVPWAGCAVVRATVLRQDARPVALLVGSWDAGVEPDMDSLQAIAHLASGALERLGEAQSARRGARQAAALAECVRAAASANHLVEVLRLITRLAAQATLSRGSALWRIGDQPRGPVLDVTHGPQGTRERIAEGLAPLAADILEHPRQRAIDPVTDEPLLSPESAAQLTSVVLVPLVAYGQTVGVLATYDRQTHHAADPGSYGPADLEFLATLAGIAAVAIDQGRRFESLERQAQVQRELAERLRREERLASVGESATQLCREARNPLASIAAFARRVHRSLDADDANGDALEIILRETERLERMLAEQIEYAALEPPRLRVESLNHAISDVLGLAGETLVRRRIRLLKKLSPDLPAMLLDPERIRRVITNVLESALESATTGGRIRIETRRAHQVAVVEIAHDGVRAPGALLEQLFVPFASGRHGGPGVGLGVAQQIVREHGGEIRVRSEGEWSTIFAFTLPILDNRDRRGAGLNRRAARRDRRETTAGR